MDDERYPTITPAMSNMASERIMLERLNISKVTVVAPMNAAARTVAKPPMESMPTLTLPPYNSMTKATPSPAPLLMPRMDGSASGLRKTA